MSRPGDDGSGVLRCSCGKRIVNLGEFTGWAACEDGHRVPREQVLAVRLNGVQYVRLADVRPERVRWLWPGRIPLRKLTMLDGDPGLGKSLLLLDLAARLTTGGALADDSRPDFDGSCGVILMAAEDSLSDTVRPRLDAAGADSARVFQWVSVRELGGTPRLPTIDDVERLGELIDETSSRLVVIDPLLAYLPPSLARANDNQEVRPFLLQLAAVAESHDAAVVMVRHLNKDGGSSNAVHRGSGAIAMIGTVRAGLLLARDPSDRKRRILAVSKGNVAEEVPSLAYRIVGAGLAARVDWEGESELSADDLLDPAVGRAGSEQTAVDTAFAWLHRALSAGERLASDVEEEAAQTQGFGVKALRLAKKRLGVEVRKDGRSGRWLWRLPGDDGEQLALTENVPGPHTPEDALASRQAGALPGPPGERRLAPRGGASSGARADDVAWLREVLGPGERPAGQVQALAVEAGISPKRLRRAREAVGVEVRKDGMAGAWLWCLPDSEGAP